MSYTKEELSQMTPAERQKCIREMQQQFKETSKQAETALKNEVQKRGVIGTLFKVAFAILLDGKHCIYCGEEVKTVGVSLRSSRSDLCYASPKHRFVHHIHYVWRKF